jgi:hypothetical protein
LVIGAPPVFYWSKLLNEENLIEKAIDSLGKSRGDCSVRIASPRHHIPLRIRYPQPETKMTRVQGAGPASIGELIDFLQFEQADAIGRGQLVTSVGALRLWALPSLDAEQAAHAL